MPAATGRIRRWSVSKPKLRTGRPWSLRSWPRPPGESIPSMVFDLQRIDRARPNSLTNALLQVPPFYQRGRGPFINFDQTEPSKETDT